MNTCGTCKFFGEPVEDLIPGDIWDRDESEPVKVYYHACDLVKHRHRNTYDDDPDRAVPEVDKAVVIDGSDYRAVFCVQEEFGCNQWQSVNTNDGSQS